MEISAIKSLLDACYRAKRVRDMLPELPQGVAPSYIQYLDVIENMESRGVQARVSDISDALHLPRPGVTRTVRDMEEAGYLCKSVSQSDGRVTHLSITPAGRELSQTFNARFFSILSPMLEGISDADAECTVRTINRLYTVMSERRINLER